MNGGMGGVEWIWMAIGVLMAVLVVVVIARLFNTKV